MPVPTEIIVAEAVPLAAEVLDPALEYVDKLTKTAGRPFHKRASTWLKLGIGVVGTVFAVFGDKIGLGMPVRIASAVLGGKYIGSVIKDGIEYVTVKSAMAGLATLAKPAPTPAPMPKKEEKPEKPPVVEAVVVEQAY